jgi:hypothetical protein
VGPATTLLLHAWHWLGPDTSSILGLFILAFLVKARVNDVPQYSPADERCSTVTCQKFLDENPFKLVPEMSRGFLMDLNAWPAPPNRFAVYWMTALLCRPLGKTITTRKLAWISTVASVITVPVTFAIARASGAALQGSFAAALLVLSSPINLAMGRRALHDAIVSSLVVAAFLAATIGSLTILVPILIALLFVKEIGILAFPGILLVLHQYDQGSNSFIDTGLALILPLAIYACAVSILTNLGPRDLVKVLKILLPPETEPYSRANERGPAHAYLVQLFLLSPILGVLLIATWSWTTLSVAALVNAAILSVSKKKNYRSFTACEILFRALAGISLGKLPLETALLTVSACVVTDLLIFRRIFLKHGVYDPVFSSTARALDVFQ